jgi:septal ring factor EnvC (AmiA/AmiB activator)
MKISPEEALRAILSGGQFRSPQQIARLGRIVSSGLVGDSSEADGLRAQLIEAQDEIAELRIQLAEITDEHAKCAAEIETLKAKSRVTPKARRTRKTTTKKAEPKADAE